MKTLGLVLLIISLGLNVVGLVHARRAEPTPLAATPAVAAKPEAGEARALRETAAQVNTLIKTGELETLAARLKAAEFPPQVVWQIVADAVKARHAADLKRVNSGDFWRPPTYGPAQRAVQRTIDDEIEKIVGPSPERLHERSVTLAGIAADKIPLIEKIKNEWGDRIQDLCDKENTFPIPEVDGPAVEQMERQRTEAIEALLTPDEKFEYRLRNSAAARQLRDHVAAMQPSEAEFRAIFTNQQDTAPEAVRQSELKATLGEERYDDYERAQDPGYQSLFGLVERLQEPPEKAAAVYRVKNDTKAQAAKIQADVSLSESARSQALAALAQAAEAKIASSLGEEGLAEFKKDNAWLTDISARPIKAR